MARYIRNALDQPGSENTKVVCVGDKARNILQRKYGKHFILAVNEIGRLPPTFIDAARLTNAILGSGYEYNAGKIIYNRFRSVVSYATSDMAVFSLNAIQVQ